MIRLKKKYRVNGFTLVEIMIVVAIIAMLAAIAIPNLLRVRLSANETAAESAIRTIHTAAQSYRAVGTVFPASLNILATIIPPYIDSVLGAGSKHGYDFTITSGTDTFSSIARPQVFTRTGVRSFFVDESGVIRYTTADANPTATDLPTTP